MLTRLLIIILSVFIFSPDVYSQKKKKKSKIPELDILNGFKYAIVDPLNDDFKFVENEFKLTLSLKGLKTVRESELSNEDYCDAVKIVISNPVVPNNLNCGKLRLTFYDCNNNIIGNINKIKTLNAICYPPYGNCCFPKYGRSLTKYLSDFNYLYEPDMFNINYNRKSRVIGAIADYNKPIELDPNDAISDYNKAIEINPNDASAYSNRGIAKFKLKDYYGAIADYTKAIELNPNYASAYNNRGIAKRKLKDYYGAIADYTKAIELNPNYASAYNNRGIAKRKLEDYYGAIADYTKAIELNPNDASAYSNRGIAKEDLGDLDGACSDWKKAANLGHTNSKKWVANQCN